MLNPSTRLLNSIIHPAESRPLFHKRPALHVLLDFDYFFTNVSALNKLPLPSTLWCSLFRVRPGRPSLRLQMAPNISATIGTNIRLLLDPVSGWNQTIQSQMTPGVPTSTVMSDPGPGSVKSSGTTPRPLTDLNLVRFSPFTYQPSLPEEELG